MIGSLLWGEELDQLEELETRPAQESDHLAGTTMEFSCELSFLQVDSVQAALRAQETVPGQAFSRCTEG
jgi:hypothetical protein